MDSSLAQNSRTYAEHHHHWYTDNTTGNRTSKVTRYYRQHEIVYVLIMKRLINSTPRYQKHQHPQPACLSMFIQPSSYRMTNASQIHKERLTLSLSPSCSLHNSNADRNSRARNTHQRRNDYLANISTCPAISYFTIRMNANHKQATRNMTAYKRSLFGNTRVHIGFCKFYDVV